MLRSILAAPSSSEPSIRAFACTAVDIVAADKSVIAGRTMEWAFDMKWTLVSLPKGTEITLSAPPSLNLPVVKVSAKYPVVGVSAGVIPGGALLEGQNSEGLGMSGNFLPGFTEYQTVTPEDTNYVSILSFGSWALGNQPASTKFVLRCRDQGLDGSVTADRTDAADDAFVFTDRSGDGMVVEYVGGQLQIHDNVAHVLTNSPTYEWHLLNARNYLNLTTVGVHEPAARQGQCHGARAGRRLARPTRRLHAAVALHPRRVHALQHHAARHRRRGHSIDRPHPEHGRYPARHRAEQGRRPDLLRLHAVRVDQGPDQQPAADRRLRAPRAS